MLNDLKRPYCYRVLTFAQHSLRILAASIIVLFFFQAACSSKRSKVPLASVSPVQVVFFPFNVPADAKDLHWVALAAPILMAKVSEQAPDLVPVPFWEAMPTAIELAGASRTFTQESAASAANWLAAKWSTLGEITPAKRGISIIVDFIPAKSNQIPFRYLKTTRVDSLESCFVEAFQQFLRYLGARPLEQVKSIELDLASVKPLAEALDREYGWFMDGDPGKAQEVVADLARNDERLARLLFNPSVYPTLATDQHSESRSQKPRD